MTYALILLLFVWGGPPMEYQYRHFDTRTACELALEQETLRRDDYWGSRTEFYCVALEGRRNAP